MKQLSELLQIHNIKAPRSQRADYIEQIFNTYLDPRETLIRKKENWKRYILFLKENHFRHSKEMVMKFKTHKTFIKPMDIKKVAYLLSPIPTDDLHFILSVSKDKLNRYESVGAYIIASIWKQK